MTAQRPNSVINGLDGMVVASMRVAYEIAPMVRKAMMEAAKRDGVEFTPEAWDWVAGLEFIAEKRQAVADNGCAIDRSGLPSPKLGSMPTLSLNEAAHAAGMTRQAIRKRIDRGTLPATQIGGRWRIGAEHFPVETGAAQSESMTAAKRFAVATGEIDAAEEKYLSALVMLDAVRSEMSQGEAGDLLDQLADHIRIGLTKVAMLRDDVNTRIAQVPEGTS